MKTFYYTCIFVLAMMVFQPLPVGANELANGSFEEGAAFWDVTNFEPASSFQDLGGAQHLATDGLRMMKVTDEYGALEQQFVSTDGIYFLTFDRNLIDPEFDPSDVLRAMFFSIILYDSNDKFVTFWRLPSPSMANTWETVKINLPYPPNKPELIVGEEYRLKIAVTPNSWFCIDVYTDIGVICPTGTGRGTVLIDNVILTPSSDYVCNTNEDCLSPLLYCAKATGDCNGEGTCQKIPVDGAGQLLCTDEWDPVCGCDGNTYGNACDASSYGISIDYLGECCVATSDTEWGKQCRDGLDNDCDGLIDNLDPDCSKHGGDKEGTGKTCRDGLDNAGDGLIDCLDPVYN